MPIFKGQGYDEKRAGTPEESVNPRAESRASRSVWVKWNERVNACKTFLGWSEVKTNAGEYPIPTRGDPQKYISRHTPLPHGDFPTQFFFASEIARMSGYLPEGISPADVGSFDEAETVINFAALTKGNQFLEDASVIDDLSVDGDPTWAVPAERFCLRYMEFDFKSVGKYQTIPAASGLRWSDGAPAALGGFISLYEQEITVLWRQVPFAAYNEAVMLSLVGKTNLLPFPSNPPASAGAYRSLLKQKASGTLLWGVPQPNVVRMGDYGYCYDVTLRLRYFPYGANKFFRPPAPATAGRPLWAGGYDTLSSPAGPLFPAADFEAAFVPP